MMLRPLLLLLLSVSAFADDAVLARVGEVEIKVDDVRASLESLDARQLAALSQDKALLEQVTRSFIVQRLVLKKALDEKWDQEPQIIAKLQRARDSTLTESFIESQTQPPAHFPDENELQAAYEQRKAALLIPRSFRLAQLFVPVSDVKAKTSSKAQIEALKAKNTTFTEIGWLAENQIQPEIRAQVPVWRAGAVTEPVWLNDGWHVFQIIDVREPRTPALDEVRAQLRLTLRKERQAENSQAWLAALLKQNPVKLDAAVLSRTLPSSSP